MNAPGVRILILALGADGDVLPVMGGGRDAAGQRAALPCGHAGLDPRQPGAEARFSLYGTSRPDIRNKASGFMPIRRALSVDPHDAVVLVHQTRFDSLTVLFTYADGRTVRQSVRRGAFGTIGAWAGSSPSRRRAATRRFRASRCGSTISPVTSCFARKYCRAVAPMRRRRLRAMLIGGAMTMLLVGTIYNVSLAVAVRRQFLAWHGIWAASVLVWGLLWSQLALSVLPQMAGTTSSQICTFLACLAVAAAAISAVTALGPTMIPRFARIGVLVLSALEAGLGVPAALTTGAGIDLLAALLAVSTLGLLIAVALCIAWAWRRGSSEARDCAFAWAVPMATLAATQIFDMSDVLFGGGAQIAVLFAAALQTAWLSVAATRRLEKLRVERDLALAAETVLSEIANSDPLTGLLNRRGFVARAEQLLRVDGTRPPAPFALLLIDVDHFKAINDEFGHEAGDAVLHRLAQRLLRWESACCAVGRLGGEEFVIAISGLDGLTLAQFAESVRGELAACNHLDATVDRRVTASVGVVEARAGSAFQALYGLADQALYQAKHAGRDCVRVLRVDDEAAGDDATVQQPGCLWPARVVGGAGCQACLQYPAASPAERLRSLAPCTAPVAPSTRIVASAPQGEPVLNLYPIFSSADCVAVVR